MKYYSFAGEGEYYLASEVDAIIAEKDVRIVTLGDEVRDWKNAHALLQEQFFKQQEQLRASNEALVAAEAQTEMLRAFHKSIMGCRSDRLLTTLMISDRWLMEQHEKCKGAYGDNLTALAENNKEVAAKAVAEEREACAKVCDIAPKYVGSRNEIVESTASACAIAIRARSAAELRAEP